MNPDSQTKASENRNQRLTIITTGKERNFSNARRAEEVGKLLTYLSGPRCPLGIGHFHQRLIVRGNHSVGKHEPVFRAENGDVTTVQLCLLPAEAKELARPVQLTGSNSRGCLALRACNQRQEGHQGDLRPQERALNITLPAKQKERVIHDRGIARKQLLGELRRKPTIRRVRCRQTIVARHL